MNDVDGLLKRLKESLRFSEKDGGFIPLSKRECRDIIATIEQQRAEVERLSVELAERHELRCPSCSSDDIDDSDPDEHVCMSCDYRMEADQAAGIKP